MAITSLDNLKLKYIASYDCSLGFVSTHIMVLPDIRQTMGVHAYYTDYDYAKPCM